MKRALGFLCAALAAAGLACEQPVPRAELGAKLAALERPHLVLVVVDTLRADWTTPYGDLRGTSPELARWAERGAVFEEVRAQSSWTKISMASLFTSLWPSRHGITDARDALGEGAATLAELLRGAGYKTYGVQCNGWLDQSFGFHQGFDRYLFPRGAGARGVQQTQVWPHADRIFEEAGRLGGAPGRHRDALRQRPRRGLRRERPGGARARLPHRHAAHAAGGPIPLSGGARARVEPGAQRGHRPHAAPARRRAGARSLRRALAPAAAHGRRAAP